MVAVRKLEITKICKYKIYTCHYYKKGLPGCQAVNLYILFHVKCSYQRAMFRRETALHAMKVIVVFGIGLMNSLLKC